MLSTRPEKPACPIQLDLHPQVGNLGEIQRLRVPRLCWRQLRDRYTALSRLAQDTEYLGGARATRLGVRILEAILPRTQTKCRGDLADGVRVRRYAYALRKAG